MRSMLQLHELQRIAPDPSGKFLQGMTSHGPLALYRYAPLQAALLSGQHVPFALQWPEHLKLFVYTYAPVPVLSPDHLPPKLQSCFSSQARDGGGLRPWDQATYQGWPLYVYTLDCPGDPPLGRVPHLFERLSLNTLPLPPPSGSGHGP